MQIFIKMLTGNTITLNVDHADSIETVKQLIKRQTGNAPSLSSACIRLSCSL